jgi:hypothetical protein
MKVRKNEAQAATKTLIFLQSLSQHQDTGAYLIARAHQVGQNSSFSGEGGIFQKKRRFSVLRMKSFQAQYEARSTNKTPAFKFWRDL